MKKLDENIKRIATHYDFDIEYDNESNKWIISSKFDSYLFKPNDTGFYWHSESTFEDFLDELKYYFEEQGYIDGRNG